MATKNTSANKYGVGVSCFNDITRTMSLSRGVDRVVEAIAGRLQDQLWYDPNYGLPVELEVINSTRPELRSLASRIERECMKEDRVDSVNVDVSFANETLTILIQGTTDDGDDFRLVGRTIGQIGTSELIFDRE